MSAKKESEKADEVDKAEKEGKEPEEKKEEISEEEALKRYQDAVNRMPVKDLVLNIMTNLVTTAYVKMGLPEERHQQYKDLDQAKQAIDSLDGLLGAGDFLTEEEAGTFRQTAANLKMTYAKLKQD